MLNLNKNILLLTQINELILSGFSLEKSLEICKENKKNNVLKKKIIAVINNLKNGLHLNEALEPILPSYNIIVIHKIKTTIPIKQLLEQLINFYKEKNDYINTIKKECAYPSILSILLIICCIIISQTLLPTILNSIDSQHIPLFIKIILTVGIYAKITLPYFLITLLFILLWKPIRKKFNSIIKQLIFGSECADIIWVIGSLLKQGICLKEILTSLSYVSSNINAKLKKIHSETLKSGTFVNTIQKHYTFSTLQKELLLNSENSGQLAENLIVLSKLIKEDHKRKTKITLKLVQPVSLILISGIIGILLYLSFIPTILTIENL